MTIAPITIWGRPPSTNVKKAVWAAEELGVAYNFELSSGIHGRNDEIRAAGNPNGLVPTLVDGDFVLWESNAIVRYLGHKYGSDTAFFPDSPEARASADKWLDWNATFLKAVWDAFYLNVRAKDKYDADKVKASAEAVAKVIGEIVEPVLKKQKYLSGDEFGFGDIALGAAAYLWFGGVPEAERIALPVFDEWYGRISARPAFKKAVAVPW
ncbi:hypothetical protein VHUM_02286 [Vanrija humicola]|uniref:Glutathione S-transferase n=1 Tax=Vanrija humicola TaxID=5417 RepID=A0A7D8Z3S5_VANHU|nr:hypothetical protein VHUM_02286 [Vanrija humicola]